METEAFVKSLSWAFTGLVNIGDSPSLVCTSVSLPDDNLSSFFISVSVNIEDLVVLNISEESSFINEDLPPI
jgi:carbonic anhydrase/acetyltransferase-like protein (isoleucine patch superfamily)